MDALYIRLDSHFPRICNWSLPPRRLLYGFPVVAWEFNTVPEHGLLHGRSEEDVRQTVRSLRHFGRGCDVAVCVTRNLADYVGHDLGIRRVLVVPNGSDPELFHPDAPVARRMLPFQGKLNVVWIGTGVEAWHDLGMLREAAQFVWEADSSRDILFHIIGSELSGIMADMPPNVYCWGAEYYEKLPNWLAGMDVGLNLYHRGPADYCSPLKVFDYMASGLAVVSTAQPSMSELLDRLGQSDMLVPCGASRRLADVLANLASNRERVRRQGLAGRQLVIDHYNWRRAVRDTMDEMEVVLRERRKRKRR
jgi:glycosyltransferase involved in cell wall biosynthesis